ncbi:MAG: aldehyde dehydrogenase family protein [Propionibacteriales bacterium]|nr:aldehyde dehydrogenase family protein [Propionibacteriales bacterium]
MSSPAAAPLRTPGDPADTADTVADAVRRLRSTFASGKTRPLAWRLEQLSRIEDLLAECEPQIAQALATDLGRPATDTFLGDIAPSRAEAKFARKHLASWNKRRKVGLPFSQVPGKAWYEYEPLGVTLVIGPWNYPVYLTLAPMVAAIAAGNCVVVKPSENAPATARLLAELIPRYLDNDAFAVFEGGPEVTTEILDQGLDHAFFTGGPEIGKLVMAAAAKHLTPVTLELGGKCPVVVDKDANLPVAARRIAWTKLLNSGQTCIAPDYLLVHDDISEAFTTELTKAFKDLSPNRDGGRAMPIVNDRHAARLLGLLQGHGGTVLQGGSGDASGRKVDVTLVDSPDLDSPLMTEEIFGPVLPIQRISSLAAAIEHINRGPKPLAAYIFSESAGARRTFRDLVPAGAVVGNAVSVHVLVPELPFGGVGNSGMGAYHGEWGFQTFSHRKANLDRPTRPDPRFVYPPYGKLTQKLLRKVF